MVASKFGIGNNLHIYQCRSDRTITSSKRTAESLARRSMCYGFICRLANRQSSFISSTVLLPAFLVPKSSFIESLAKSWVVPFNRSIWSIAFNTFNARVDNGNWQILVFLSTLTNLDIELTSSSISL